ncbi:hypothetical protein [Niallia sp. Krafla_26]|uniref:hypothetical protein n=1 Tax=Niallia sp. Krafla_26 TaxID=3064703 RepID=UPI003D16BDB8
MPTSVWKGQIIASGVNGFNEWKSKSIAKQLDQIVKEKLQNQQQQDVNFENALKHMIKMRQFLSKAK